MKNLFILPILLFSILLNQSVYAQCAENNLAQNTGSSVSNHNSIGQTFTASCAGNITSVTVVYNSLPTSTQDRTLNIRNGALPTSPIIHTQMIPFNSIVVGTNIFTLTAGVPINTSEVNAWEITSASVTGSANGISFNSGGAYPLGSAWFTTSFLMGIYDITFEVQISSCPSAAGTDTRTECDSLLWIDGLTYYSTNNIATHIISGGASNGCDSIVTLDLTINNAFGTDTRAECDSLLWIDGITYYSNNSTATYSILGAAASGCDSIVTLGLTINNGFGADIRTECDSLVWIDGITYFSSNNTATYNIVGGAASSCDSLVTLDLTIINSTAGTDTRTECDSLVWIDGLTYTMTNNTATHNIVGGTANGCDSLVTLDLTIINSTTGTDTRTECDSLVWIDGLTYTMTNNTAGHNIVGGAANGCDSLVTLDLAIINSTTGTDTRTECGSLIWIDGLTYSATNNTAVYKIVGGAANGCDSLVILDLTINTVNSGVTQMGITLTSDANGATYQWLNCDSGNSLISGEINQSFTPNSNGNYAVEIMRNGCIDTSACIAITAVGILEGDNVHQGNISIYPNPSSEFFQIDFEAVNSASINIQFYTLTGELVFDKTIETLSKYHSEKIGVNGLSEGAYVLKLSAAKVNFVKRVIITK